MSHFRHKIVFWGFLAVLAMPCRAVDVTVFAAASLTDSLKEIGRKYSSAQKNKILFNFAASNVLARQIEEGAPADIFFSADEERMDALAQKGLLLPGTRQSLLGNALVVITPADSTLAIHLASDLTNSTVGQIALADPDSVPAGIYAEEWLAGKHLWPMIVPKVVPTQNVRAALAAVESGNADAGVVYKTDVRVSHKVKIAFEVPIAETPAISYPMAVVKGSAQTVAARQFLNYLATPDAAKIFIKHGFTILPPPAKR